MDFYLELHETEENGKVWTIPVQRRMRAVNVQFLCMYLGIRKKTTITASTAIDYGGCSHATKATRGAVSLTSEL